MVENHGLMGFGAEYLLKGMERQEVTGQESTGTGPMRLRDDAIFQTCTKVDPSENLKWLKIHCFITCIFLFQQRKEQLVHVFRWRQTYCIFWLCCVDFDGKLSLSLVSEGGVMLAVDRAVYLSSTEQRGLDTLRSLEHCVLLKTNIPSCVIWPLPREAESET